MRIVSGYRTRSFFMELAAQAELRGRLQHSGCGQRRDPRLLAHAVRRRVGYYPNSSFVHLDVRDTNSYWVDYAGPGEAPRGTNKREHDDEAKAICAIPKCPKEIVE